MVDEENKSGQQRQQQAHARANANARLIVCVICVLCVVVDASVRVCVDEDDECTVAIKPL